MAGKEDQSRPTRPPLARGEDSPPGQYKAPPARSLSGEPIARIALRAQKVPDLNPNEEMLRALAATEGRMLEKFSDEREAFEEQMRKEIRQLVVHEVKSTPAPPPPPEKKKGFEWSHLQYVGGVIVAITGLIALILNAQKPSPEVIKRFDAIDAAQARTDKALSTHIEDDKARRLQTYEFELDQRAWISDVLERAASVKVVDPPGTPPRSQLGFYPAPKIDPHKITSTHIVQPRDPYPVPPQP